MDLVLKLTEQTQPFGEISAKFGSENCITFSVQRFLTAVNVGILDGSTSFLFQLSPQLSWRCWVDAVPDPLLIRKCSIALIDPEISESVTRHCDHLITEAVKNIGTKPTENKLGRDNKYLRVYSKFFNLPQILKECHQASHIIRSIKPHTINLPQSSCIGVKGIMFLQYFDWEFQTYTDCIRY
jgi:hypothetical protein